MLKCKASHGVYVCAYDCAAVGQRRCLAQGLGSQERACFPEPVAVSLCDVVALCICCKLPLWSCL